MGPLSLAAPPRIVVVTRKSEYTALLERHGTHEQARFFLASRGQDLEGARARHEKLEVALSLVAGAIPLRWRRAAVLREDLPRFVFEAGDVVVTVGQDGLVANAARVLDGQAVVGVNPDPAVYDGVLARHAPRALGKLLARVAAGEAEIERRTRCQATLDDGQRIVALNELFAGHRSHQSARYRLRDGEREERQSSSGVIVATGTGATGWARSIARERADAVALPGRTDASLCYFVREAFPSVRTGTALTVGPVRGELELTSEMDEGGTLFGDGLEDDRLSWGYGVRARISVAAEPLALVVG